MKLTPAISPLYDVGRHVCIYTDINNPGKGITRAVVKEIKYNIDRGQNVYFLETYSVQEDYAGDLIFKRASPALKITRLQTQIVKGG